MRQSQPLTLRACLTKFAFLGTGPSLFLCLSLLCHPHVGHRLICLPFKELSGQKGFYSSALRTKTDLPVK